MDKRKYKRHTKRVEVEFKAGARTFKGISSNVSENGLFIRTNNSLVPGSPVELTLYLPDSKVSKIKGYVRRAVKTNSTLVKNGMGVEIIEYDKPYAAFLKSVVGELKGPDLSESDAPDDPDSPPSGSPDSPASGAGPEKEEFQIIACPHCGIKNKIPVLKLSMGPKCGRCKEALHTA